MIIRFPFIIFLQINIIFLTASKKFNYDRTIVVVLRWKRVGDINAVHLHWRV